MLNISHIRHLPACILGLAAAITLVGCSKKEAASTPTPAVSPAATAEPATPTATPVARIQTSTDIQQSFAEADAALKAKAYEKAVQAILAVQQQKQLTEQQAQEARNRMLGLQQNLAAAIASGDPNARAAGELLRHSAMFH